MLSDFVVSPTPPHYGESFIHSIHCWRHRKSYIYLFACNFNLDSYQTSLYSKYAVFFPDNIKTSVDKRQAEFLVGRFSAQQAMKLAGFSMANMPTIGIGKNRSPIWPQGYLGSITHSKSKAACILANNDTVRYLGIDIEEIFTEDTAIRLASHIHNDEELNLFLAQGLAIKLATTIIFSAKESLFKAIHPTIETYVNFDCCRVRECDAVEGELVLELNRDVFRNYSIDKLFKVSYSQQQDYIFTSLIGI